jgi:hypothetical protein
MSPNEFVNEVKEQPIVSGLVIEEILRNSLVELSKKLNIANIIGPNEFEKEIHKESVVSLLAVKVSEDFFVELPEEVSAMLGEF